MNKDGNKCYYMRMGDIDVVSANWILSVSFSLKIDGDGNVTINGVTNNKRYFIDNDIPLIQSPRLLEIYQLID